MITKIFSVYDTKTESYGTPFFMPTSGAAIRAFVSLVHDDTTMVGRHPSDYVLFEIGTYDDSTGVMNSLKAPVSLGIGSEYLKNNVNGSSEA